MDTKIDLLEGTASFYFSLTGSVSGETYKGTFTIKGSLSPLDSIKADKRYRELMGANPNFATQHVSQLCFALSQLEQRVLKYPNWWSNQEINGGH